MWLYIYISLYFSSKLLPSLMNDWLMSIVSYTTLTILLYLSYSYSELLLIKIHFLSSTDLFTTIPTSFPQHYNCLYIEITFLCQCWLPASCTFFFKWVLSVSSFRCNVLCMVINFVFFLFDTNSSILSLITLANIPEEIQPRVKTNRYKNLFICVDVYQLIF